MSACFDFEISVKRLCPSLSADHLYAARVIRLVRESASLVTELNPDEFGITEVWGRSAEEARAKLQQRMYRWIAQQHAEAELLAPLA